MQKVQRQMMSWEPVRIGTWGLAVEQDQSSREDMRIFFSSKQEHDWSRIKIAVHPERLWE